MNKTELENEINELKKKVYELEARLEEKEVKKGEIWKPEENENFYALTRLGKVVEIDDQYLLNLYTGMGNCYQTEDKAQFEADREKYTRLFRQYVEQHSEPLDWENIEQEKSCVYSSYYDKELKFDYCYMRKAAFAIYASSKEVLQEAIDFVGEDNFKKYILEIKE